MITGKLSLTRRVLDTDGTRTSSCSDWGRLIKSPRFSGLSTNTNVTFFCNCSNTSSQFQRPSESSYRPPPTPEGSTAHFENHYSKWIPISNMAGLSSSICSKPHCVIYTELILENALDQHFSSADLKHHNLPKLSKAFPLRVRYCGRDHPISYSTGFKFSQWILFVNEYFKFSYQ